MSRRHDYGNDSERAKFTVSGQESLAELKWVAFARNDHPKFADMQAYTTIEQFAGLKVLDYLGDGWGEQHLKSLNPEIGGSFSQVILKLALQRGDVFIQMETVTKSQLKELMQSLKHREMGLEIRRCRIYWILLMYLLRSQAIAVCRPDSPTDAVIA